MSCQRVSRGKTHDSAHADDFEKKNKIISREKPHISEKRQQKQIALQHIAVATRNNKYIFLVVFNPARVYI